MPCLTFYFTHEYVFVQPYVVQDHHPRKGTRAKSKLVSTITYKRTHAEARSNLCQ